MSTTMSNSPDVSKTLADCSKAVESPALQAAAPDAPHPAGKRPVGPRKPQAPTKPVGGKPK